MFRTPFALHFAHGIVQCSPTLNIYTGFIPSQLMTNTSGCYILITNLMH